MTLSYHIPTYNVTPFVDVSFLANGAIVGHSYYI